MLLVATTRENVSPSLVLELLRRIGGIIKVRRCVHNNWFTPLAMYGCEQRCCMLCALPTGMHWLQNSAGHAPSLPGN